MKLDNLWLDGRLLKSATATGIGQQNRNRANAQRRIINGMVWQLAAHTKFHMMFGLGKYDT